MKKNIIVVCDPCPWVLQVAPTFGQFNHHSWLKEWQLAKAYTKRVSGCHARNGYGFKTNARIRSFAEQMLSPGLD